MYRRHEQPLGNIAHLSSIAYSRSPVPLVDILRHLLQVTVVHLPNASVVTRMVGGSTSIEILLSLNRGIRNELV